MGCTVLLLDGAADEPLDDFSGRTPLEVADLTLLHRLGKDGTVGWLADFPSLLPVYPEVSLLEVLGYDGLVYYPGRSALRAVASGVPLEKGDVVFSVSFVSSDGERITDSALDLDPATLQPLWDAIEENLTGRRWRWFRLPTPPFLVVLSNAHNPPTCQEPDRIAGRPIKEVLPEGEGETLLSDLIYSSLEVLDRLEINKRRQDEGLPPANLLWFHEPGRRPSLPPLYARIGPFVGEAVTNHQPFKGLLIALGFHVSGVAPGSVDADPLPAILERARDLVREADLLIVHFQGADRSAHRKDPERKVDVLQRWEREFCQPFLDDWIRRPDPRLLILCSHRTSSRTGCHERGGVPFLFYPKTRSHRASEFHEASAESNGFTVESLTEISPWLLPEAISRRPF